MDFSCSGWAAALPCVIVRGHKSQGLFGAANSTFPDRSALPLNRSPESKGNLGRRKKRSIWLFKKIHPEKRFAFFPLHGLQGPPPAQPRRLDDVWEQTRPCCVPDPNLTRDASCRLGSPISAPSCLVCSCSSWRMDSCSSMEEKVKK